MNLSKMSDESTIQYISRIIDSKSILDITWDELADIINRELHTCYSEGYYRRGYYLNNPMFKVDSTTTANHDDSESFNIKLDKLKNTDILTQANAYMRRIAREETIIEIAKNAVDKISKSKPLVLTPSSDMVENTDAEAIAVISDWHYGIEVNNHWNKFNPDVCIHRVRKYLEKLLQTCELFNITRIHLVNLSDLIAGRIHATIRLESREDVISQTIHVSEILAQFINELTQRGYDVEYYDCLDNHSRLEPIKSDSLDLESLVRIIPWYLKERFKGEDRFTIHTNEYSDDIITFTVLDGLYDIGAVHGHKDRPQQVIQNLTLMTKKNFDLILTAHLHHWAGDETNRTIQISNGSLMGTDSYAKDLRLDSQPSQNIIVATKDSVCDYIRRVPLDD